jgi:DNA polymerase-3 subunit epsilon
VTTPATSWGDGPILALDLETTGVDPHTDRIVTAGVVVIRQDVPGAPAQVTSRTWLADPGVDIPAEASAIHGITTGQARRDGRPVAEVVSEVTEFLAQVWTATTPLCAFNASFDLTMLDAESRRHHGRGLVLSGSVVDPMCIDRHLDPDRAGRRHLAAVCEHYRVRLENAHTSTGDALAAARLAWRLARSYPDSVGRLEPHVLHSHQAHWFRDQALAYVGELDRRIEELPEESEESDRLRARADDIRASAKAWPLLPAAGERPARRILPPLPGGPARSHASWTADQDAALREEWLAEDSAGVAATLHEAMASRLGRSLGAIRSRLLRLGCDPELPGQLCDDERAAHLREVYAAEYRAAQGAVRPTSAASSATIDSNSDSGSETANGKRLNTSSATSP